jgi:hypothetical protein
MIKTAYNYVKLSYRIKCNVIISFFNSSIFHCLIVRTQICVAYKKYSF